MSRIRFHLSSYRHQVSIVQRLLALLTYGMFAGTSMAVLAAPIASFNGKSPQTGANSSSSTPKAPRLLFVSPTLGASESGSDVAVAVKIRQDQEVTSLTVKLNGHDVTARLLSSSCERNTCTLSGTVAAPDGLKDGSNALWASVSTAGSASGDVRWITFNYQTQLRGGTGNTVDYYDPVSVGIKTVTPGGGTPWIQITTGSTMNVTDPITSDPSYPVVPNSNNVTYIPYPDRQFSTDCTSILQAVVLNRQMPSQKEATGCGDTVAALESDINTSLQSTLGRSLDSSDLVVLGTTSGNIAPSGLNTTDFGGTDYSSYPSNLYPQQYMLIGVKGSASCSSGKILQGCVTPGTAHENYNIAKSTLAPYRHNAFLDGTLMEDGSTSNYNYVPSGDRLFSVTSGTDAASTSITVGGHTYSAPPNSSNLGEFWLLVLDRKMLQPVNYPSHEADGAPWVACQGGVASQTCGGVFPIGAGPSVGYDLQTTLSSISPNSMLFLVAAGCPFTHAASSTAAGIAETIGAVGGVPPSIMHLYIGSNTCAYSLVSVNDGQHKDALTGNVAFSANQYSAQGQIGALHGFLARGNSGLYDVAGKAQAGQDNGTIVPTVNFAFEKASSAQRTDWPLTTSSGLLAAYHDVSYQLLTALHETGSNNYDMRYFYTDAGISNELIGEENSINNLTQSSWDTASPKDFLAAKKELYLELVELDSAMQYLTGPDDEGGVRGILNNSQSGLLEAMFSVAQNISKLQPNAGSSSVDGSLQNGMNMAAGVVSTGAAIASLTFPEGAAFLGVLSGTLWAGSAAAGFGVIPGPENYYDVTLSTMVSNAGKYTGNMLNGFDGAVNNIFSDASKLHTVSGYTSDSNSGWTIHDPTEFDTLNAAIVDGATRALWMNVLPSLYGVREMRPWSSPDPRTYGSNTGNFCAAIYGSINKKVPATSMTNYSFTNPPTAYIVYIFGVGTTVKNNFTSQADDTPVSGDFSQFLTTAPINVNGKVTDGLNIPADILYTSGPLSITPAAAYSQDSCVADAGAGDPQAGFTITPAPKAETIRRGGIGIFVLQLNSVNGFKGNVRLSCSGGPPDSQCGDLPQTVKVNGTAYALSGIRFPKKTVPGTYTLTFTGVSNSQTNSTGVKFTVK